MKDVLRNGLYLDLNFKGALHISLFEYGNDKLVVNLNSYGDRVWADFICLYGSVEGEKEFFRIGGEIFVSNLGHNDLRKWIDICLKELDWSIDSDTVDKVVLDIFNMISGAKDYIIRDDTIDALSDQEFKVNFFYPCPDVDPEDEAYDDDEEEEIEEVVEEIIEETTEELIDFENFEFVEVHERGGNKRSDKYIDKRVGSVIYAVVETDEEGNDHFVGGDILKASKSIYGSPSRVVSIYNLDDVVRVKEGADDVVERIIKASDLTLQAEIEIAEVVLKIDIEKLLDKIQEGLEWKASSQSTNEPVSEYYY